MITTNRSVASVANGVVYVAFELGKKQWKLAMTSGFGVAPVLQTVAAGEWTAVDRALAWGRHAWGSPRRRRW